MKRILITCFFAFHGLFLLAQTVQPHERLYLSTDKECYLAGEPVWVSVFCYDISSGKSSPVSAVAYLEIQNTGGSHVQTKIALKYGRGSGVIDLPLSLPTGIYRLTGYTRYMHLESEDNFHARYITVYNPLSPLRSDNVATTTAKEEESFPVYKEPKEETRFGISANKKNYNVKQEVELTLKNLLPENVSASVSVFRVDGLNHFQNPSITEVVSKTFQEEKTPFQLGTIDYSGEVIHGYVVDQDNERVNHIEGFGAYLSIAGSDIQYITGEIQDNGKIRFFTSNLYGDGTLVSYIPSANDKKHHLILDPIYLFPTVANLPALVLDKKQEDVLLERSLAVQLYREFRLDTLSVLKTYGNNLLFESSGISYKLDEYTRFPTMAEVMIEFIQEARFRTVRGERKLQVRLKYINGVTYEIEDPTPPLVLLDGIPVPDHEKIYNYPPSFVEEIIIYPHKYAFGPIYYNGIVFFKTYRGDYPELELEESMRIHDYKGVQHPSSFGIVPKDSRFPDLRHTLYWNPKVEIKDNESLTLRFQTAETTGTFKVVAEGLSSEGTPFRTSAEFRVDP
ncbi:MAG: hypothetical protein GX877_02655 [Bacteroidales bacterium]|nr:hypothetical protein [Bacteroidales bacterium]